MLNLACVLTSGQYNFHDDPTVIDIGDVEGIRLGEPVGIPLEAKFHSSRFFYDRVDISGGVGWMVVAADENYLGIGDSYQVKTIFLGSQIYPFGVGVIAPAFGAGVGTYRYFLESTFAEDCDFFGICHLFQRNGK